MILNLLGRTIFLSLLPAFAIGVFLIAGTGKTQEERKIHFQLAAAGAAVVIPTALALYIISPFFGSSPVSNYLLRPFLGIAFPEETAKYLVLIFLAIRHRTFNSPMSGITMGAFIALGFAAGENILYLAGSGNLVPLIILRSLSAVPLHVLCGAFSGLIAYRIRQTEKGTGLLPLIIPVLLHGTYNAMLRLTLPILLIPYLAVLFYALIVIYRKTAKSK